MTLVGYTGRIGNGKTYNCVRDTLHQAWKRDALVLTNIALKPQGKKQPWGLHQLTVSPDGIIVDEVLDCCKWARARGHGIVMLIDEINTMMPARMWAKMPPEMTSLMAQSRHYALDVNWTAQYPEQIDTGVRNLTDHVNEITAWPKPTTGRRDRGERPLVFRIDEYPPNSIGQDKARKSRDWHFYRRQIEQCYDTDEVVYTPRSLIKDREAWPYPEMPDVLPDDMLVREAIRKKLAPGPLPMAVEIAMLARDTGAAMEGYDAHP